jgi:hypothetical protein
LGGAAARSRRAVSRTEYPCSVRVRIKALVLMLCEADPGSPDLGCLGVKRDIAGSVVEDHIEAFLSAFG